MRRKVTVIGAGNVGATVAQRIVEKELADVVLVDVIEGVPQGKGLDMIQSGAVEGFDMRIVGSNGYEETEGSDLVIVTAGLARKPGMSRDDLLRKNEEIVASCISKTTRGSRDLKVIVVTNPLDAMCEVVRRITKLPKQNVIGMAGILDSARMRAFISMELDVSIDEHPRDRSRRSRRHDGAAAAVLDRRRRSDHRADLQRAHRRDRQAHGRRRRRDREPAEDGSAYYAPSAAAVEMAEAILKDKRKILPCAAYLEGEYGYNGLFVGVPVKLGRNGLEEIIEIKLEPDEAAALKKSAGSVQELVGLLTV